MPIQINQLLELSHNTRIILETNYYNRSISAERAVISAVDRKLDTIHLCYLVTPDDVHHCQTFHLLMMPKKNLHEVINYYNDNITHRFWLDNLNLPLTQYSYYGIFIHE